jgi:hypothetical protein
VGGAALSAAMAELEALASSSKTWRLSMIRTHFENKVSMTRPPPSQFFDPPYFQGCGRQKRPFILISETYATMTDP